MRSSASRSSSKRSNSTFSSRKSKTSSTVKEDGSVENIKIKWKEICEEEGVEPLTISRSVTSKISPKLETYLEPQLKIVFQDDDSPSELQVEGELTDGDSFRSICSLASSFPTITVLRLIDCKLKAEAILIMGLNLFNCSSVKEIYLDLNPVHGEDYSQLLNNNKTLEVLSLKGCDITKIGAKLISEKLSQPSLNLRILNLNTNLIDDEGAEALAKGLKWNNRLFFLSLAGNIIGTEGAVCILNVLKEFPLDEEDLFNRRVILQEKANLILDIVNERKEEYLKNLPPMPTMLHGDLTHNKKLVSSKTKIKQDLSKLKSHKEVASSTKDKKMKKAIESKPNLKFGTSSKPTPSSVGFSDNKELSKVENMDGTGDLELVYNSDDSLSEFSKFSAEIQEEWDSVDNIRRYKERMVGQLIHDVAVELSRDPAFQVSLMSSVFISESNGLTLSRGNLSLTHINLAYNKINIDIQDKIMELIYYQSKFQTEAGCKRGLKMLMLEGNLVSHHFLADLEAFFEPKTNELTTTLNEPQSEYNSIPNNNI